MENKPLKPCTHDIAERETDVADGMCPQCLMIRISDLESQLVEKESEIDRLVKIIFDNGLALTMNVVKIEGIESNEK